MIENRTEEFQYDRRTTHRELRRSEPQTEHEQLVNECGFDLAIDGSFCADSDDDDADDGIARGPSLSRAGTVTCKGMARLDRVGNEHVITLVTTYGLPIIRERHFLQQEFGFLNSYWQDTFVAGYTMRAVCITYSGRAKHRSTSFPRTRSGIRPDPRLIRTESVYPK